MTESTAREFNLGSALSALYEYSDTGGTVGIIAKESKPC